MFKEVFAGRVKKVVFSNRRMSTEIGNGDMGSVTGKTLMVSGISLFENEYGNRYVSVSHESGEEVLLFDVDAVLLSKE